LAYPRGIATDAQGNILVANTGNDRIDVFDQSGNLVRSFGSSGRATGQFNQPLGAGADPSGIRGVADAVNGRLQLLNPDGSIASVWGSPAPGPTVLPRAVAVVFDGGGNAYVLDQRRARIVVFSRATGLPVRMIGSQGSGPGQLQSPSALAIDGAGTLSVADTGNGRIARFTAGGSYLGSITEVPGVRGIATSPDGTAIYVTDDANHISRFTPDGDQLDDFGGTGTKLGKLNAPAQLALDGVGNLWVADRGNNRVQQFGPEGQRLLAFGTRGTALGQFIHPTGVAVDCRGTLTVTDSDNGRVQQFALAAPAPAPAACAALPALATPPPPKLPTLPGPVGPQVSLRLLRTSGLLGTRTIALRVGCDTTCRLTTSATVTPRSRPKKGKPVVVTLSPPARTIAAGQTAIVRPAISRTQLTRLRKALKGRRGLSLDLQLSATSAGEQEPTTVARTVQVVG
jgi:DNA-binding beta-propeller fold protein YncE